MQTRIVLWASNDSCAIDCAGTSAWPDGYLEEFALRHAHADLVLLVARSGILQKHGRHRDILYVYDNAVLSIQHNAAIDAFEEDVYVSAPDDVLALHPHTLSTMQRDLIVRVDRQALIDRRCDPVSLRDFDINLFDTVR